MAIGQHNTSRSDVRRSNRTIRDTPGPRLVKSGRYGIIEIQTADTHGSYRHTVETLHSALDLHRSSGFAEQVAAHPDWPAHRVEGPNISNVFKRTFYQVMVKF
jgi:hypothetical protein